MYDNDEPFHIEGAVIYGAAQSRRGRVLNWIRRRLGRDEQDEIIEYLPAAAGTVRIVWDESGKAVIDLGDD